MSSTSHSVLARHFGRHIAAYALAALMGVLAIAPYLYFAHSPSYQGVTLLGQDAEEHYVARIQQALIGYPALGNTFLPYKNTPYLAPGLGEDIVAAFARIFHSDAESMNNLSKIILPFLTALLMYGFAYRVSRSRSTALLSTAIGMLGSALMSSPSEVIALLHGTSATGGLLWARPINPEISDVLLFASLWLLYGSKIERDYRIWRMLLIAALVGTSLYVSAYVWSFLGVLVLIIVGDEVRLRNTEGVRFFLGAGVLALMCAIPFASNYLAARSLPGYAYASMSMGLLHSRLPQFGVWLAALLSIPLFLRTKALYTARSFFLFCGLALLIVLNQQIVSGFYLQPGHYHWYVTKPLVGIMLGLWVSAYAVKYIRRSTRLWFTTFAIAILILDGVLVQRHFYELNAPAATTAQAYAPVIGYLNSRPPETVYADATLSLYVPMYTRDAVPTNPYAKFYIAPPGYFDALNRLGTALRNGDPSAIKDMHDTGITAIVEDTRSPFGNLGTTGLVPSTTIAGRFVVYRLP